LAALFAIATWTPSSCNHETMPDRNRQLLSVLWRDIPSSSGVWDPLSREQRTASLLDYSATLFHCQGLWNVE
jgi:hypothetical protein